MIRAIILTMCVTGSATVAPGQDDGGQAGPDKHVQKLDAETRRMVSHLSALPAFHVDVAQEWKLKGGHAAEGRNRMSLAAQHNGGFRLEVGTGDKQAASLVCAGDGRKITRVLQSRDQLLHSVHEGSLKDLLDDAMTESSLRHSGLDLLFRQHPERVVMVMASDIEYLGTEDVNGVPAHHFTMKWGDGDTQQREMWIAADDRPLLLRTREKILLPVTPDKPSQLTVTSSLTWKQVDRHPEDQLQVEVPRESVEVADLHCHLVQGGAADLVGKPAPSMDLKLLDGADWALPQGDKIAVLYFFAGWAVPSHQEKEVLLELLKGHTQDIVFSAISVGEDQQTVGAFAELKGYEHSIVLDPDHKAAAAYRVTCLPTIVVIDKSGTVQAVLVGNTPEVRAELRRDLQQLLAGKQLVSEPR